MAYQVKCFSKDGEEIAFQSLDKDICLLWHVELNKERWAVPPDHDIIDALPELNSWHEFIGQLIYFSMEKSGKATASYLLDFYLNGKSSCPKFLEYIKNDIYNISLLLYLMSCGIYFTVQYSL